MKAHELLNNKSSAYIAKATSEGYQIKVRIKRSGKNTPDTYQAEIKVFAKGEKWHQCYWFNCQDTVDSVIKSVAAKFSHISFTKEVKTVNTRKVTKKAKSTKKSYYIKTCNDTGPTTIKTDKPLFEAV